MSFASRDDYRVALRDHRSIVATLAMFVLTTLSSMTVTLVVFVFIGGLGPVEFFVFGIGGGILWTWRDAAHRVAGRRLRTH